jgi:hypothetical protein
MIQIHEPTCGQMACVRLAYMYVCIYVYTAVIPNAAGLKRNESDGLSGTFISILMRLNCLTLRTRLQT